MNIILYKNNSDAECLDKRIEQVLSVEGTLREETDILDPDIVLELPANIVSGANYAFIDAFNRYYYIVSITSANNGLWRVKMHCDVLMSFKNEIRAQKAVIARNEFDFNGKLSDSLIPVESAPAVQTIKFPDGFDGAYSYVMCVMGNTADN